MKFKLDNLSTIIYKDEYFENGVEFYRWKEIIEKVNNQSKQEYIMQ